MKFEIIDHLIMECSLDNRITDGMFNPLVQEHMNVLIEKLLEMHVLHEDIREFTNKIVEGKFPERQAYNKEGFLVTFPTPDYKAQALSSGDYFNYDPTSGKGGMHLVRKADPSAAEPTGAVQEPSQVIKPEQPETATTQKIQPPQKPEDVSIQKPEQAIKTSPDISNQPIAPKPASPEPQSKAPEISPKPEINQPVQQNPQSKSEPISQLSRKEKEPVSYGTGEPEGSPLDLTDFSAYKDPSLEWAHNQKWEKRDNGNYYDSNGKLRAVIGIDGSAVPATEQDRISIRQWLDKKRQERLPGEKL